MEDEDFKQLFQKLAFGCRLSSRKAEMLLARILECLNLKKQQGTGENKKKKRVRNKV